MTTQPTSKQQYKSRYTDRYITAPQYIAELVCENIARKNEQQLVVRFWNTSQWKSTFRYQLILANGLLRLYDASVIVRTIRENGRILSLKSPVLDSLLDKPKKAPLKPSPVKDIDTTKKPPRPFSDKKRKNLWSALNGKKEEEAN